MRISNKYGLPLALVNAVQNDGYRGGVGAEFSATNLSQPPQLRQLWKEHGAEIEEDVADRIWSLLGQSLHVVLERANRTEVTEKRLYAEIGGAKISGQLDSVAVANGKISDWKMTSIWSVIYGGRGEWAEQLNVYAELLDRNGITPRELEVVCVLRDWQKSKAEKAEAANRQRGYVTDAYPVAPVAIFGIPLWPKEQRVAWITERVQLHRAAGLGDVIECSDEERWIRKKGDRPTRCLSWCAVSFACQQHARYLQAEAAKVVERKSAKGRTA